jgi:hypothetical protein
MRIRSIVERLSLYPTWFVLGDAQPNLDWRLSMNIENMESITMFHLIFPILELKYLA